MKKSVYSIYGVRGGIALLVFLFFLGCLSDAKAARVRKWLTWENCQYVPNESANDGDSFWIKNKSRRYKLRLYFVDTPETTDKEKWAEDRLKAQAEYFKTSDVNFTLKVGKRATKFTRKLLSKKKGFTVYTRKVEAMGRGKTRYYAMIKVDGRFLSELLTEQGYVRINKRTAIKNPLPEGLTVTKFEKRLHRLESQAKRAGVGGWSKQANKSQNSVQKILEQRKMGQKEQVAKEVKVEVIRLKRITPIYSVKKPGRMVKMLKPHTPIKIMGSGSKGMVTIRFNPVVGKIYEAECRRQDLGI